MFHELSRSATIELLLRRTLVRSEGLLNYIRVA
jgi:hypothetical protein